MKWLGVLYFFAATTAQAADMVELNYVDQDSGDAPYPTRILITPDFLRMDGGEAGGDFVLLDRKRQQVVNVMRASRTALVFRRAELPRPFGWKASRRVTRTTEGNRVRVSVKGVECSDTTTAKGLHPDAVRALTELKTVLAARQYATWKVTPSDVRYDCDLANQVWEFKTPLQYGLPVSERDFSGRTRRLKTHRIVPAEPELFKLPADVSLRDAPDL